MVDLGIRLETHFRIRMQHIQQLFKKVPQELLGIVTLFHFLNPLPLDFNELCEKTQIRICLFKSLLFVLEI